jgi:Tfp pilus assembly major pilin PilA
LSQGVRGVEEFYTLTGVACHEQIKKTLERQLDENEVEAEPSNTNENANAKTASAKEATGKKINTLMLGSTMALIMLILSLTVQVGYANVPMLCHRSAKSNLVTFKQNDFVCSQLVNFLDNPMQNENIDIFRPNVRPFSFEGFRCMLVSQSVDFRTDFFNYDYKRPIEQKIMKISADECKDWKNFNICDFGKLEQGNDKERHTGNTLDIEYKYFSS